MSLNREKHGFGMALVAMSILAMALIYVWVPSTAEKDVFRKVIVNQPPLGHWIYTVEELKAVRTEVYAIESSVRAMAPASYKPEMHFRHMERLINIEKSLLPIDSGHAVPRGVILPYSQVLGKSESFESLQLYRGLVLEITRVTSEIADRFRLGATNEELDKARQLNKDAQLFERSSKLVVETDYHAGMFLAWFTKTHIESMFIVFFFFLLRAEIIGQKRRILVYDAGKTVFWMFFWPVGIWRYPNDEPVVFIQLVQHRLAMAMTFLFTVAVPNLALAQSGKVTNEKNGDPEHTLVIKPAEELKPKNAFAMTFEAVNKYHGQVVGEIFATRPAPRFLARYTRTTMKGEIYLDSWNSVGRGFNAEADIGLGYAKSGWDTSYTHFLVRGGDIGQIAVSKSGSKKFKGVAIPLGAIGFYYLGTSPTSPPGGIVAKVSSGVGHKLISGFKITHRVSVGLDNNPFGLGKGLTAVGFYTADVSFKQAYFTWNASAPIRGQNNTTRGYRQSISAGYRHAFTW